jgi:biopolymer transport protein ExbD
MKVPVRTDRRDGLGLREVFVPMIDVTFLLLIFFIWTTRFQQVEYLLPLSDVAGTQSEIPLPQDLDPVVVRLRTAGAGIAIEANGSPMESEAATFAFLRSLADLKAGVPVILSPDDDVAMQHVVRIYDGARLAGFETLQFAVDEE